jgi:hypothetical protein
MRTLLLCALLTGCATLPPVAVEQTPPELANLPKPLKDQGQVVVEAVDAPGAQLAEITGAVRVPYGGYRYGFYGGSRTVPVVKWRCSALPCAVDVPRGETTLEIVAGKERTPFRVDAVSEQRTFVRARLAEHHVPALGVLGWVLASVSAVPIITGTTLLAADPGSMGVPGAVTLIGGVALTVVGAALGLTHPFTTRPQTFTSWTE